MYFEDILNANCKKTFTCCVLRCTNRFSGQTSNTVHKCPAASVITTVSCKQARTGPRCSAATDKLLQIYLALPLNRYNKETWMKIYRDIY